MTTAYNNIDEALTTAECADISKTHNSTIYNAIKSGDLKAFVVCPGPRKKYRVMKSDLIAWLTAKPVVPGEAA